MGVLLSTLQTGSTKPNSLLSSTYEKISGKGKYACTSLGHADVVR